MKMKSFTLATQTLLIVLLSLPFTVTQAVPLKSATVTEAKNDVKLSKEGAAEREAKVSDTVVGKDAVRTGKKSKAELEFSDKSIARLGANTVFSFDPESRKMQVDRGTALIHVPPGLNGAQISSPAATAAIMGDVVAMRVDGAGVTQIVALTQDAKGPVTVTIRKTGETRTLQAGEMLTIDPKEMKMPEPRTVAVDVMVQSSGLAGGFKKALPTTAQSEIKHTETVQEKEIKNGNLEVTGKLKTGNDANSVTQSGSLNNVIVQNTSGGAIAGRYVGIEAFGGIFGSDPFNLDVKQDGSFTISTFNPSTSQRITGSGTMNANGNFTANLSDGSVATGNARAGSSTISGSVTVPNFSPPPPTVTGVFSASK